MGGIVVALTGCTPTSASTDDSLTRLRAQVSASTPAMPQGVPLADGWYPNERLFPAETGRLPQQNISAYRQGVTADGFTYKIFPDGSADLKGPQDGIVGGWSIDCSRDAMTDQRKCKLSSYSARIFIYYGPSAVPQAVCIIGHDFPGRSGAIRIDAAPPIQTNRDGCVSGQVATALASGSKVTTRRVTFPYDYSADDTAAIAGLKSAMELVTFIRANIGRLTF